MPEGLNAETQYRTSAALLGGSGVFSLLTILL